jgi:photosystem II stability/assembly factor-like uncharacterized protein
MAGSIERLLVATQKGLFTVERPGGKWALRDAAFEGEEISAVLADARDGAVYAAIRRGPRSELVRSDNAARSFESLGSLEMPPDHAKGAELLNVCVLEAAGRDALGELWAGTLSGALFHSRDRGEHFDFVDALWQRPERLRFAATGFPAAALHSVSIDPRDSRHLLVAISRGGVFSTRDAGGSFEAASGLFSAGGAELPDPRRLSRCRSNPDVVWCQHERGVYRSTDAGTTFAPVAGASEAFGFAIAAHPYDAETAWFVPVRDPHGRVQFDRTLAVYKTRDGGGSFERKTRGLPQQFAYDVVYRHALDVDESGTLLAMGSTTGNLYLSADGGESFEAISHHLPPIQALRFSTARVRSPTPIVW